LVAAFSSVRVYSVKEGAAPKVEDVDTEAADGADTWWRVKDARGVGRWWLLWLGFSIG
jgi:hypothetical protein